MREQVIPISGPISSKDGESSESELSLVCTVAETGPERYRFYHRMVLYQGIDRIWSEIRDAQKLAAIVVPAAKDTFVWLDDGGPDMIPSRFQCTLENSTLIEEVVFRDDLEYVLRYRLVQPALGMRELVAACKLTALHGRKTLLELSRDLLLEEAISIDTLRESAEKESHLLRAHFGQ
jgi:hypothetical protein